MFKRRKPDDVMETAPPLTEKLPVGVPPARTFSPPGGTPPSDRPGAGSLPPGTPQKELPPMGRTPFPGSPQQPTPTPPSPPTGALPPGGMPGPGGAPRPAMQPPTRPALPVERRTLVVGKGISVQGTVQDAERLVVEGTVEASMIRATELSIAQGGVFKGAVEVEEAEIAGTIDGTLTVRSNLIVRATGKVLGTAHYRRLQVEDGGQITGELKMTLDGKPVEPAKSTET